MADRCAWCLEWGHVKQDCPKAAAFAHVTFGEFPRTTDDDAMGQLRDRFIAKATYAGQLERLLRQAAVSIPPEVASLNPDVLEDA